MIRYKAHMPETETPTNNGGFLGGLGYLGNKVGIGFMQTFEGAWDYAAGGIADLFGADEWARRQMENDWFGDWYYSADKNFNPGKGWKIAGDVAGGIGNVTAGVSAAALAVASAVGITMATGGTGLPVSASVIGSTAAGIAAGLGAAGNATKEAYAKTGELTGKEYGYGALVGATEGVIEGASNLIAPGAGKVGKGLYKAIAGEAAENAAKTGLSKVLGTAVKHAGTNFISEAVEEGTAEILAPQYAKLTYDPNAENATPEEVIYASFIGGLSGVLAGGGEAAILGTYDSVANYRAGKKAVEAGYTAEIEGVAKRIAEEEAKKPSGYALFEKIREVYERRGSGYSRIGALQRMTTASRYLPAVEESAKAIVSNPEYSAARFLAIGAKNPDGTPLEITPEKLTEGFDRNADSETALHSLRRALSTNPLLLTLSVADATGKMMLDAENYAGLLTGGGVLTTRGDYQTFLAKASDEQKAAVAQHFGLTAPLDAIPYKDMVNIATGYAATPEGRAAIEAVGNVRYRAEQIEKNEKPLPKVVGEALADGIYRYGDVAIIKEGGSVRIYDYETRSITMAMTPQEATAALQKYRREQDTAKAEERRAKAEEQRKAREEELDTWAREHIKRYRELVGNEQREIRTLIRQGRALGLSDADIETYATVSARSSVRVTFSKEQCRRENVEMKDGKPVILVGYADGFYSPSTNEIVVNPEGKRSAAKLLMHELSHALYKDRRFAEVIDGEVKHMDEKRKKEVRELYEKAGRPEAEISEDLSVHHVEDVVGNRDNLARMMKEEPTLGDKILSFFKLAKTDYKGHSRLSLAAGRLYRTFETILASFSEFNRGNLAAEGVVGANPEKAQVSDDGKRYAVETKRNGRVDKKATGKYNRGRVARYIPYEKVGDDAIRHIRAELQRIYNNEDGFADGIAIEYGVYVYTLDSGRENGHITFGIRRKQKISDSKFRSEFVRSTNNDVLSKGHVSDELSSRVGDGFVGDSGRSVRREYRAEFQADSRESNDNQGGILGKNADNRGLTSDKRFSIDLDTDYLSAVGRGDMETAQRMVDEAAESAMPNSLLREGKGINKGEEEEGTLVKMFHGSGAKGFYKFESHDGALGKGIYLTSNWDEAVGYAIDKLGIEESDDGSSYIWNGETYDGIGSIGDALESKGYVRSFYANVTDESDITTSSVYWGDVIALVRDEKQVKSADPVTYDDNGNIIPLSERFNPKKSDIRDALPADFNASEVVDRGLPVQGAAMSVGQAEKMRANLYRDKVYSAKEAMEVVKSIPGIGELGGREVAKIGDAVWSALNACQSPEQRYGVADKIARYITARMYLESEVESPDAAAARERLSYYRMGIGGLTFSKQDLAEIRHTEDTDGLRRLIGRWGYKGRSRVKTPMDVFVADVARAMPGMEYLEDMPPVEAFLEINSLYESAVQTAGEKVSAYEDAPPEAVQMSIDGIRETILRAFDEKGDRSRFARIMEDEVGLYKRALSQTTLRNRLVDKARKLRDIKTGKFANATQVQNDTFKTALSELARLNYRGNLLRSSAREHLGKLADWYAGAKETILLYESEENPGPYYSAAVEEALRELADGQYDFSTEELQTLENLFDYFLWLAERYDKVYNKATKNWESVKDIAESTIGTIRSNQKVRVRLFGKLNAGLYSETFNDPMSVARRMDMYAPDGFYTKILQDLRESTIQAQVEEMNIRRPLDAFLSENKQYLEKARLEKVSYRDQEIPRIVLIGLYMTYKREQAWRGLAVNGFVYEDNDGNRTTVRGTLQLDGKNRKADEAALKSYVETRQKEIEALLTDADREYIGILEEIYNEKAKRLKAERDYQRRGISNVQDGYYYPIRRYATKAKSIDETSIQAEIDRISNASFNKDTVKGASQALVIDPADSVLERHLPAVCNYAFITPVLDYFNTVYNYDVSGNANLPVSVRTASEEYWKNGYKYLSDLFADAQGVRSAGSLSDKAVNKALSTLRGGYAKAQLGGNPKVWITQLSSFFSAMSILDYASVLRGMTVSSRDVDKYCPLAELRSYENSAAMAQAVTDRKIGKAKQKVDKIGDALMTPIGKMDRFVIGRLFGACQVQVERDGGAKVGTDENKVEAGKLLQRVILETQQNSLATERSSAMRSQSEMLRMLTMFTSDAMKAAGRVIDGYGEVSILRAKIKGETDAKAKAALSEQMKVAKRKARKALAAIAMQAAFMVGIAQLFRFLYAKEEEEPRSETMLVDFVGNLLGGLPIISDVYSFFFEGYEIEDANYSAINDVLNSVKGISNVAADIAKGESDPTARNRAFRNLAYSLGQVTGLPVRNIYNVFYGLTKRIFPTAAYSVDGMFYGNSYEADLAKAIEKGDDKMAAHIFGLILGEKVDEEVDSAVFNELLSLAKQGYKVLPKTVRDTVTVDGEEYELTDEQVAAIRQDYTKAQSSIGRLVRLKAYQGLDGEARKDVLKRAYAYTYELSEGRVLGTEVSRAAVISQLAGVDLVALFMHMTKDLESDLDKSGNVIEGSLRRKVVAAVNALNIPKEQKLILLYSRGYSAKDGDIKGVSAARAKTVLAAYIAKAKGLSKAQREELAKACGLKVTNGRISVK